MNVPKLHDLHFVLGLFISWILPAKTSCSLKKKAIGKDKEYKLSNNP